MRPSQAMPDRGAGRYPVHQTVSAFDPATHRQGAGHTATVDDQRVVMLWDVEPIPLDEIRRLRKAAVTERRAAEEASGLLWTRSDGKVYFIATDPEKSQGKLNAERSAALAGLRAPGDVWKCADAATGAVVFIAFTDDEIVDIANAARAKVSATFRREGELHAAIDAAATAPDVLAVDITAGWPA